MSPSLPRLFDVASAFYHVVQQIHMPLDCSDEQIAWPLSKLHVPADAMHTLHNLIAQQPVLCQAKIDLHLPALISEHHQDTHFVTDVIEQVARTHTRTNPGLHLADILYDFLEAHVVHEMASKLVDAGVTITLSCTEEMSLCNVACGFVEF